MQPPVILSRPGGHEMVAIRVEAARYAVQRRIAPAIRHDMVGNLNPLGMLCELMHRRLFSEAVDLKSILENVEKIKNLSSASIRSCCELMTWLEPAPEAVCRLAEGIEECIEILRPEFCVRAVVIDFEAPRTDLCIARSALRAVLPAALMAVADSAARPVDILLHTASTKTHVTLTLITRATNRVAILEHVRIYREIMWQDVEALAIAESVEVTYQENCSTLRFLVSEEEIEADTASRRYGTTPGLPTPRE